MSICVLPSWPVYFLLDCSNYMAGEPIRAVSRAVTQFTDAIHRLEHPTFVEISLTAPHE